MTRTISRAVHLVDPAQDTGLDVVTGAFSYSGAAIAAALLERGRRVRTITGHAGRAPAGTEVEQRPLDFDNQFELVASLPAADLLAIALVKAPT